MQPAAWCFGLFENVVITQLHWLIIIFPIGKAIFFRGTTVITPHFSFTKPFKFDLYWKSGVSWLSCRFSVPRSTSSRLAAFSGRWARHWTINLFGPGRGTGNRLGTHGERTVPGRIQKSDLEISSVWAREIRELDDRIAHVPNQGEFASRCLMRAQCACTHQILRPEWFESWVKCRMCNRFALLRVFFFNRKSQVWREANCNLLRTFQQCREITSSVGWRGFQTV